MAATAKQQRFAELYLGGTFSAAECYRRVYKAGGTEKTVMQAASKVLNNASVRAIIDRGREMVTRSVVMDQAALVRAWSDAATVDRNELVEVRRHCCRHCYGRDHDYQETPAEHKARRAAYMEQAVNAKGRWPEFDERGGVGYDRRKPPLEECPECSGFGVEQVLLKDTRTLSPAARSLYEGVDIKNGAVVVKVRDRGSAEERLAKHLGMLGPKENPPGVNLNVFGTVNVKEAVPDDAVEASKIYQKLLPG